MPCFAPAEAFPAQAGGLTFSRHKSWLDAKPVLVPCNQCVGCRMAKGQEWATRITHEAALHDAGCFLTLTFSDEHLPWDGSVSVRDVQLFCKRLRKACGPFRFFACGEYGEQLRRPHYHLLVFGIDFAADRKPWRVSPTGHPLYRSATLERLWPFGHCEIGTITRESAGYVARYCLKKVTGDRASDHYQGRRPEFAVMSRRPGIGSGWYDRFSSDAFPSDFVIIDGSRVPVPRYYAKKLEKENPDCLWRVKIRRKAAGHRHADNNTPERLEVREEVQLRKLDQLPRNMEKPT